MYSCTVHKIRNANIPEYEKMFNPAYIYNRIQTKLHLLCYFESIKFKTFRSLITYYTF